jgi:glutamate/tyrosine decarboxylase-like PLP-dependent enzyme
MANLVGITVARNAKAEGDLRREGLRALPRDMVLYGSVEMHSSIMKALELLGLGRGALCKIPVNDHYQIDVAALQTAIVRDRNAGRQPFCVVANAGTVNTGAIDDINRLADVCETENLWLHVDGAFGALASLSPLRRHLLDGMTRADSLAFDLHKWMYMPLEIGCVLVRSEAAHRDAFAVKAHYLDHGGDRGMIADARWYSDYGVQLSRGFRALKAWMSMKAYGIETYARMIEKNIAQAIYLSKRVDAHPELECCAPVSLNIVCFRYKAAELDDGALNALNRELLIRLHESGAAVPSYTTLAGRYVLRVAITNHRSQREDFDFLVEEVVRLGRELKDTIVCHPAPVDKTPSCWFGSPS